jgi:hypothetical protein
MNNVSVTLRGDDPFYCVVDPAPVYRAQTAPGRGRCAAGTVFRLSFSPLARLMAEQVTTDRRHAQNKLNRVSVVSQDSLGIGA